MNKFDDEGKEIVVDSKTEKARQETFTQLSKKAILVNLKVRQLQNVPYDMAFSQTVCKDYNIKSNDRIIVRKFLFNPEHLAAIRQYTVDATMLLWNYSAPWENVGYRLLSMEYYDDFMDTFSNIKDKFETAVRDFVDNYEDYVAEAKKYLGKAFNKKQYPDASVVSSLFTLELETAEFPDIDDIRLNLTGENLVRIREEVTQNYNEAIQDTIDRLAKISKGDLDAALGRKVIDAIKTLNVSDSAETNMLISELSEKFGEETMDEADMMVMSDIDDDEFDNDEKVCHTDVEKVKPSCNTIVDDDAQDDDDDDEFIDML